MPENGRMAEADVVVVGGGPGGLATAYEAAARGLRVVLIEARDELGGNAARSTGYMAFVGSDLQLEAGIEDSNEAYLEDCRAEVARQADRYGIMFDEALTRKFIRESHATYELLCSLGFRFDRFIRRPEAHRTDRMLAVDDVSRFRTALGAAVEDAGVTVRRETRALRLVEDGRRVCGLVVSARTVKSDGSEILSQAEEVHAARAVVLAAGGYQANPLLRARYQPARHAGSPYLGIDTARGDGHIMGQAVGGDLINMTMLPPLVMVASALVEDCIAVNLAGERFHDETGPYDDRVAALRRQPQEVAFYVYDDIVARRRSDLVAQMPRPSVTTPTLAGLARRIGVDPAGLKATAEQWNGALAVDPPADPVLGRRVHPADRHGLVEPPFHAVPMVVGVNFPAGGFRVDAALRVWDVFGEPIDGLYAVGDCVGGINPAAGLGGMHICSAISMGRVAARAIANGPETECDDGQDPELTVPAPAETGLRMAVVDVKG
jgi:succinate dehydrogenase/fumarate reductase flavoprotein subunit